MNTGIKFHIIHSDVKIEVRKYDTLSGTTYSRIWEDDKIKIDFAMQSETGVILSALTDTGYGKGKKVLRFTSRSNGDNGIILVARFPIEQVKDCIKNNHTITKTHIGTQLSFCYTISFSQEILEELKERVGSKRNQSWKPRKSNAKTQYICYNPKPFQGGGFSGK